LNDRDFAEYSFWLDTAGEDLSPRPALPGDESADVAVVGAGFTGLWTAYYLTKADPSLRVLVLEKEIAGFGASGRNGGWCTATFPASGDEVARRYGPEAALAMQGAMFQTVDEVGRVCEAEGIDAHYAKGGTLTVATTPPQVGRLKQTLGRAHARGFSKDDCMWLDPSEAAERIAVNDCLGATYTPHCAALHPARLARGLARVVERLGVRIHERTTVTSIEKGRVRTDRGVVRAGVVVRALEGYTDAVPGHRRLLLPLHIFMIATEPLPQAFWREVRWRGHETLADASYSFLYAQRTADDRIAIGGRGARYHFGSAVPDPAGGDPSVTRELVEVLRTMFPAIGDVGITHRWGGYIGVPRDWFGSVGFDAGSGLAWGGGHVGDGVSVSNLAGRTLADLITGRESELARLPWVGHAWRKWEPEPLRWIGVNLATTLRIGGDRAESRTGRPSRMARIGGWLMGA